MRTAHAYACHDPECPQFICREAQCSPSFTNESEIASLRKELAQVKALLDAKRAIAGADFARTLADWQARAEKAESEVAALKKEAAECCGEEIQAEVAALKASAEGDRATFADQVERWTYLAQQMAREMDEALRKLDRLTGSVTAQALYRTEAKLSAAESEPSALKEREGKMREALKDAAANLPCTCVRRGFNFCQGECPHARAWRALPPAQESK